MNLGAFAVVALVRNATGSEDLDAFRGLVWRSPLVAITMALFLFSLLGLPPLAGFAGKFQVFEAIFEAGQGRIRGPSPLGTSFYLLLAVGAVNTAVSAYYYLMVPADGAGGAGPARGEADNVLAGRTWLCWRPSSSRSAPSGTR